MKPTVGRIVHCYSSAVSARASRDEVPHLTGPFAGLVTAVAADWMEVTILQPGGVTTSQTYHAEPSEVPTAGRWCWPPRSP